MSVNLVNKSDGSLSKIAGKVANGELIPSVSYYQSGQKTSDTTSWSTGETGTFTINLSENMPDTDYIVVPTLNVVGVSAIVHSKTVNSFKVTVRNDREETIAQAITLYWQAFKLMTDENRALDETAIAQNTSDISDLQAVVPETASESNQLVTDRDITLLNNRNRKITFNNTHSSAQISGYWYKLTFQLSSVKNDAYGANYSANQHWNVFDCITGGANIKDGRFRLRLGTNISGNLDSGNCYLINDSATDLSSVVEVYTDTENNCIYFHAVNSWTCWATLTLLNQPFNDSWLVEKVDDTLYTFGNAPSSIDLTGLTKAAWQNSPMVTESYLAGTPTIGVDAITLGRLGLGDTAYNKINMGVRNCSDIPGEPCGSNGQALYAVFGVIEFAVGPISDNASSWKPNTICKVRVNHAGTYGDWVSLI